MFLSNLQEKDIIDITNGKKIGMIIDVSIKEGGQIEKFYVQKKTFVFFIGKKIEVKWEDIEKIGKDVILIKMD